MVRFENFEESQNFFGYVNGYGLICGEYIPYPSNLARAEVLLLSRVAAPLVLASKTSPSVLAKRF